MKTYLLKERALSAYKISETEIDRLIEQHLVNTVLVVDPDGNETVAVYDDDLAAYVADRDITPDDFHRYKGVETTISEASLRFQIDPNVLYSWIRQGRLNVIREEPRRKKIIDMAEVAYLATVGKAKKMRPGKKPFSSS